MLGIMHARILARGYVARYACECLRVLRVYVYACMHARGRTNDDVTATQRCILLIQIIARALSPATRIRIFTARKDLSRRALILFNIPDIVLALHHS